MLPQEPARRRAWQGAPNKISPCEGVWQNAYHKSQLGAEHDRVLPTRSHPAKEYGRTLTTRFNPGLNKEEHLQASTQVRIRKTTYTKVNPGLNKEELLPLESTQVWTRKNTYHKSQSWFEHLPQKSILVGTRKNSYHKRQSWFEQGRTLTTKVNPGLNKEEHVPQKSILVWTRKNTYHKSQSWFAQGRTLTTSQSWFAQGRTLTTRVNPGLNMEEHLPQVTKGWTRKNTYHKNQPRVQHGTALTLTTYTYHLHLPQEPAQR